jgi:hypothetical protein
MTTNITTWADGFANFHCALTTTDGPNAAASIARQAIKGQIAARAGASTLIALDAGAFSIKMIGKPEPQPDGSVRYEYVENWSL